MRFLLKYHKIWQHWIQEPLELGGGRPCTWEICSSVHIIPVIPSCLILSQLHLFVSPVVLSKRLICNPWFRSTVDFLLVTSRREWSPWQCALLSVLCCFCAISHCTSIFFPFLCLVFYQQETGQREVENCLPSPVSISFLFPFLSSYFLLFWSIYPYHIIL